MSEDLIMIILALVITFISMFLIIKVDIYEERNRRTKRSKK